MRVMIASGMVPRAIAGRTRWRRASTNSVGPSGEQRVDEHEAGRWSRGSTPRGVDPALRRQPPELHREDVDEGQPEHEDGDADPEQRDDGDAAVDPSPAGGGRRAARAGCPARPRRSSPRRRARSSPGTGPRTPSRNGSVVDDRRPEVEVEQLAQVVDVLELQGSLRPRFCADRLGCRPRRWRAGRGSTGRGSPGIRCTNANRMIDSPNRTGIAASNRQTMYLSTCRPAWEGRIRALTPPAAEAAGDVRVRSDGAREPGASRRDR